MSRSVAEKMGVRAGARAFLAQAPDDAVAAMALPDLVRSERLAGLFDRLHLFVASQAEINREFPRLKPHLAPGGALSVSWPKGRRGGTDLTIREVIRIGYDHGLVESTALRVDDHWSALKFTWPKPGKAYANSYGRLPD